MKTVENWKKTQNALAREKKQLKDTAEAIGYLHKLFEEIITPRMQYKRVRTALMIAKVAVEKQIPKKVIENRCPECGRIVGFRHCERCGQRLEW